MAYGNWFTRGGAGADVAAIAAATAQLLAKGNWHQGYGKGGTGGQQGKGGWGKGGGNEFGGGASWGGERRPQWQCPVCTGPNGKATQNRDTRACCHRCGEAKPKGSKGLGKGGTDGGKSNFRRGHSPIGANGNRPLLGGGGPRQEGDRVRGRSPGLQRLPNDLRPTPMRYVDAARTATDKQHRAGAPTQGAEGGKGGSNKKGDEGNGRREEPGNDEGGFTRVGRSGGKNRISLGSVGTGGAEGDDGRGRGAKYFRVDDESGDGWNQGEEDDEDWEMPNDEADAGEAHQEEGREDTGDDGGGEEWDLDKAKEHTRLCREMLAHLRRTVGRNHALAKKAAIDLQEAEQAEKVLRGPRTYWQEGRKDARRKGVLLRLIERLEARYEEERAWFQEMANEHEDRQQATRDQLKEAEVELQEIKKRDDAYAAAQERNQAGGDEQDDTPYRMLGDTASRLAGIIEASGDEQLKERLNLLSADLGNVQDMLRTRRGGQEQEEAGSGAGKGGGKAPREEAGSNRSQGNRGRWHGSGKGRARSGSTERDCDDDGDDGGEDRRRAKLAARQRGEGSRADMETETAQNGKGAPPVSGSADGAGAVREETEREARRQRALDTIRGRLQLEKHRKLAERQKAAIQAGTLPEPHEWSEEQLRQGQRQVELLNAEVDAEAEQQFAALSDEAKAKLLEEASR